MYTGRKKKKTTTPSVVSSKKIWEYMVEKKVRLKDNADTEDKTIDNTRIQCEEDNTEQKIETQTRITTIKKKSERLKCDMKKTFETTVNYNRSQTLFS